MKIKIKNLASWIFWAGAVFPRLAFAQWSVSTVDGFGLPKQTIINIVINITDWLLYAIGFFAIISFAISGIFYLTSAGDQGQIDRAKRGMTYSIIGILVAISGLVAIYFADNLLNGSSEF